MGRKFSYKKTNLHSNLRLEKIREKMEAYEKAHSLLQESKSIIEKSLGKEKVEYVFILMKLSQLYEKMGMDEKAKSLSKEVKSIYKKIRAK